jgi:hypothetical protein
VPRAGRLAAVEKYLRYLQEAASVDLAAFTAVPRTWASAERFLQGVIRLNPLTARAASESPAFVDQLPDR